MDKRDFLIDEAVPGGFHEADAAAGAPDSPERTPEQPGIRPRGRARNPGDPDVIDLEQAFIHAAPARHLFILGHPGAGKTTALKKLLWSTLAPDTGQPSNQTANPAAEPAHPFDATRIGLSRHTVPAFVRLRALEPAHRRRPLPAFLDAQLASPGGGAMPAGFGAWLWQRGHLLLLFDGLDEIANPRQREDACHYIEDQLDAAHDAGLSGIRAAVSCRHAGVVGSVGFRGNSGFATLDIRPLSDEQIEDLTSRWFGAAERALEALRTADAGRLDAAYQRGFANGVDLAATLCGPDHASRRMLALVANPLLLTLLCVVVFQGHEIPKQRVTFFRDCLRTLLGRWRGNPLLPLADALSVLQPLAWHLHTTRRKEAMAGAIQQVVQPELDRLENERGKRVTFGQLLDWLRRDAGVLAEFSPGEYGFMHLTLQEYLVASHVAVSATGQDDECLARLADGFGDSWWREVVLLFVALPEYQLFAPLVTRVLDKDAGAIDVELLRACLDEANRPVLTPFATLIEAVAEGPAAETAVRNRHAMVALRVMLHRADERVRRAAARIVETYPRRSLLAEQAALVAGVELSRAAREGEPWQDETTGTRFLWIPGGEFLMGEEPAHPVRVSPFWLGETPVTNAQYEKFVRATGYEEPEYWRDSQFNDADQPVVTVSWDDAMAFCAWLSESSGERIILPSEAQWEFAARGPDNRKYPWGDEEPDETRANYDEKRGATTPVGSFPAGRGPFGALDQAGNVWEWCRDAWDREAYAKRATSDKGHPVVDPLVEPEGQDESRAEARAVRGGSWLYRALLLRAAFRGRGHRRGRADLGFRVAATPAARILDS